MNEKNIPIASVALDEQEIDAVVEVLRSGALRQGKKTAAFEQAFAGKVGAREAIAVSSGSAALHIAYLATIKPGDEVLVPAFSHISTASMVYYAGGRLVLCDIDPETYTLDLEDASKRISARTTGIAPVHLFGNACAIEAIERFARGHKLAIIWDAAQAHGTEYKGKDVGGFDDLVCYSFYPTKNMLTGEGGMITTNDPALAETCRQLRSHGQTKKYYHPHFGLNYRMTDVEAAIGIAQLDKLDKLVDARRNNARRLTEALADTPGVRTPHVAAGVKHSYHQYTVQIDPTVLQTSRDEFVDAIRAQGVGAAVHYPRPIHKQPAIEELIGQVSLPVCELLSERVLSLPVHPLLSDADLDRIAKAVKRAAEMSS